MIVGVLLELDSRPGRQRTARLVMADDALTINRDRFAWSEIDRVYFSAIDNYLNGAYLRTTFTIMVGTAAQRKATFILTSGTVGALKHKIDHETRDAFQAQFNLAVEVLDRLVCRRLIAEVVATVQSGVEARFADLTLDRQAVHKRGLPRRSIVWSDVAGTERTHPYLKVLARHGRNISLLEGRWNVVLIPRVLAVLVQLA